MLRSLFAFTFFIPWTLFVIFTGVPLSFVNPDYLHSYARIWARVGLLLGGARLRVEGEENLPRGEAVIYMANHQSNFDILSLFAGLPVQFRWLAKEELFRVPFFGYAMKRTGYIPVNRADRRQAMESMAVAAKRISEGTSVVIFPEGTRSPDGQLLPFKKGGFLLAMQAGVPIVPVAILGSCEVMGKKSLSIHPGPIRMRIFPPLPTGKGSDREELMETVRRQIASALSEQSDREAR